MGPENLHCHISCFSRRKLAAGVAYLPWTEISDGEGMGCCCNHFLHHHFLQVDSFEIVSPHFLTIVVVVFR